MKTNPRSPALPWDSLTTSAPGDIRVGPIQAIPALLADLGANPRQAFAQAGVDRQLFLDPDNRIQIDALGRLLESCVELTGCAHFGLLLGARFDLKGLGPLGDLMRNAATVGEALRGLLLHLHLHDRGAAPLLLAPASAPAPACALLGYSVFRHGTPALAQILDAAIAIAYAILNALCGPTWKARQVQFSHSQPASSDAYHRVFRCNVSFDAEVSGIVFDAAWLEQAIKGADTTLHELVSKAIRDADARSAMSFAERVQGMLPQMLLGGMASAEAVACQFAIHERTLRRRLEREGKNLQELVNQARFELAQQLLQNTSLSVSVIATALCYDDPNAFSRAFRNWAQLSPTQWRGRQ